MNIPTPSQPAKPVTPAAARPILSLGIEGFTYADLYDPIRLAGLTEAFHRFLAAKDENLWRRFDDYRAVKGEKVDAVTSSNLLVEVAGHLGEFVGKLFSISDARGEAAEWTAAQAPVFRFKKEFLQRRVLKRYTSSDRASLDPITAHRAARLREEFERLADPACEGELAVARLGCLLLDLVQSTATARDSTNALNTFRLLVAALKSALPDWTELSACGVTKGMPIGDADNAALQLLTDLWERWSARAFYDAQAGHHRDGWVLWRLPEKMDYEAGLVERHSPPGGIEHEWAGPEWRRRRRDGFALTDPRMAPLPVLNEVDYCIFCHERDKDSCSKGLFEKDGPVKSNPLGIKLEGCPLGEKISEAHLLKSRGDSVAALSMVMIDNPMCPGTGHRICNDCMKSCIYQKQEPVNIPQIETRILTDVLELPWGFEIYSLLARWNPLNVKRPHALPYNGKNVLVVGMGPAGYTLAHHLINEGFGVVGVDGLKIEPLPSRLTGSDGSVPEPIRDIDSVRANLDERLLAGFGGVSEYGITVRWDKNFLTVIRLMLERRRNLRIYGGIRFGGTVTIEDAFDRYGFDHIAIATGAGKPTVVKMKNNLIKGIRMASDFLMALQLTGAFKNDAMANLQIRLPALVIGGGLTAIDTATELLAYYPRQVEKVLTRYEALVADAGEDAFWAGIGPEDRIVLTEFFQHARAIREERTRAARAGELPDLAGLVQKWGGVRIVYRKDLADAPAYRLNHEEVIKAFEEGISFVERMSPIEAVRGENGSLDGVVFEEYTKDGSRWKTTGQTVRLPARSLLIAAGTSPNVIYEREYPGTFELDAQGQFFQSYREVANGGGEPRFEKGTSENPGFFTSYHRNGRHISFYGDNHPKYAGNVVKAMASAKDGYSHVVSLFADELNGLAPELQPERDQLWSKLIDGLNESLLPTVERVERLTPTIVDVVVRAPKAASRFQPGQFFRLQNFETLAPKIEDTRLSMEGIALTGAWVDQEKGLLSLIVLEMGVSSRLCAYLRPGEPIVVMGPTGTPTSIPKGETVLLAGGGLGNAVLFSIAQALKANGNRVIYFAGYKKGIDLFKQDDVERGTDVVVWATDIEPGIAPRRPQDRMFVGNIVQAMNAYGRGQLGVPSIPFADINRIIAIGSDRMMNAVREARHGVLADLLPQAHVAIGSINSTMQCMMKEICAQCLQMHVDPVTGDPTGPVFSCFNQDQPLDQVDFLNLNERLKTNSALEHVSNKWLNHLLAKQPLPRTA